MFFFRLIRLSNLLMIALTQVFIRFFLFPKFNVEPTLTEFQFFLLVSATVLLAGAGNIINDISDVETDKINKASEVIIGINISEKTALLFYIIFNLLAVGIGFYLSNSIGKPAFAVIFVLISALLYFYTSYLKRTILLGNIVVSFLTASVFLIVGIVDLLPKINLFNPENKVAFRVLLHFSIFAFGINFIREIIKDQQDVKGDYNCGMKTLPIVAGRKRTNSFVFAVVVFSAVGVVFYMYEYLFLNTSAVLFTLFLILAPLLFLMIKILEAEKTSDYQKLSLLLKFMMLVGIIAVAAYPVLTTSKILLE